MQPELLAQLHSDDHGWHLVGDMNFGTVSVLLSQAAKLIDFKSELLIDMQDIDHADSAGLALMLEWLDHSRMASGSIRFRNTPQSLLNIARVCNVESLLPLE